MALGLHGEGLAPARRDPDVEIARVRGNAFDRTAFSPELAAHDPHAGAVVIGDLRNFRGLDVLVARRRHLQRRRQVGPQLEAVHAPLRVSLRHFLVENAAPGRHPLHVAGAELAAVSQAVAVVDAARQHVGDGLDAAVRMPGKSGPIVLRPIVAEVVEQEEGIELARLPEAEGAPQLHARAFDRGFGFDDALHGPNGHRDFSLNGSVDGRGEGAFRRPRLCGRHGDLEPWHWEA